MFGMLRGVTEVVSGVTVTVEDHEIMSLGVTQAWSLPPDDNLSSDWLLSPHLWLAPGTRHQASHWTIISGSGHSLNTLDKS